MSPDNGPLWLQVADILTELGRRNEALEACREALRLLVDEEGRARAEALRERLQPRVAAGVEEPGEPAEGSNVFQIVRGGRPKDKAAPLTVLDRERTTFADVGGLDDVKDAIRLKIVLPFERPEVFQAYKKKQGGGILLYGPPGCGKTLLARATAGECKRGFLTSAIDDVSTCGIGESERKLAALFERARSHAPTVLFFDEVDAIGASRADSSATARAQDDQPAARRDGRCAALERRRAGPGRHQRALARRRRAAPPGPLRPRGFVPPPDRAGARGDPAPPPRAKPAAPSSISREVAKKTDGFSGADLLGPRGARRGGPAAGGAAHRATSARSPQPTCSTALKRRRSHHAGVVRDRANYALYANKAASTTTCCVPRFQPIALAAACASQPSNRPQQQTPATDPSNRPQQRTTATNPANGNGRTDSATEPVSRRPSDALRGGHYGRDYVTVGHAPSARTSGPATTCTDVRPRFRARSAPLVLGSDSLPSAFRRLGGMRGGHPWTAEGPVRSACACASLRSWCVRSAGVAESRCLW